MANFSYTITQGEHKGETLWSGRYCAVIAIVMVKKYVENTGYKHFLLVSKRGKGVPNDKGCWNIQCGFLEDNETGAQCASRETYEETGVMVPSYEFVLNSVNTDPSLDKNVTLSYLAILDDFPKHNKGYKGKGGEKNEVEDVVWLDMNDANQFNNMKWAFNHKKIISKLIKKHVISNGNT